MYNSHTAKKPTISSSFYDSYTNKPIKWYEIVDSYRQYTETYLPLRLENFPRDLWENLRNFFKSDEATEEIDDDEPVTEIQQTRGDGNVVKITEYDLSKDNFNPIISGAVRTHSEKVEKFPEVSNTPVVKNIDRQSRVESRIRSRSPSVRSRSRRRHRHRHRVSPSHDNCPECRAIAVLAAQGYPTMCNCDECRNMRTAYPNRTPYCNCEECRNTRRVH